MSGAVPTGVEFRDRIAMLALTALAALLRLPGLGRWGLAVDEYYLFRATELFAEHGLPRFSGGGYYVRGLLVQFASLPCLAWIADPETAIRLVPALCGIATVPLTYRLARTTLPSAPSLVAATMLALSAWHIEFSRFARMYAPFGCLFVLFLIAVRLGWFDDRRGWRWAAILMAVIGPAVYAGAIFMPLVIAATMLRLERPFDRTGFLAVRTAFLLVLWNVGWRSVGFRNLGLTVEPLPVGYMPREQAGFVLVTPSFELLHAVLSRRSAIVMVAAFVALGVWLATRGRSAKDDPWQRIVLLLAVALPLAHQFGLLAWCLVLLVLAGGRARIRVLEERRLWWLAWGATTLSVWAIVAWILADEATTLGRIRGVAARLLEHAPVVESIVEPFASAVPRWSILAGATLTIAVVVAMRDRFEADGRRFVLISLLICLAFVPVFRTMYYTTRYSFFLLPLIGIVAAELAARLADAVVGERPSSWGGAIARALVVATPLLAMGLTEDLQPRLLVDVSNPRLALRIGEYERFARHWYPRADFAGPARAVQRLAAVDEPVVIDCPPCAMEFDRPFAVYVSGRSRRFETIARERGTRELWTGRPLISEPDELARLVPPAGAGRLWLVTIDDPSGAFRGDHALEVIAARHGLQFAAAATGVDGRVTAWAVTRVPPPPF